MRTGRVFIWFLLGFAFWSGLSARAEVQFQAELSQTRLRVGEKALFTIRLEGEELKRSVDLKLPELAPYFQIVGKMGPSIRTEMSIINGKMSRSTSWEVKYILQAQSPGKFTIPALSYQIDSRIYHTEPIEVEILEAREEKARQEWDKLKIVQDPFLSLELDKTEAYLGEQVVASWYLYYRRQIFNLGVGTSPALKNFKAMELESATQLSPATRYIQGKPWNMAFIRSLALFPLHPGELEIGSFELRYQQAGKRQDFFGMPIIEEKSVRSPGKKILVKPLPQPAPEDFSGAVGKFQLKINPTGIEVRQRSSFQLVVEIYGDGNPDYVLEPKLEFPESFEVYPPEVKLETEVRAGRLFSYKKFQYVLVPERSGNFQIPPISFCYFDPELGKYQRARVGPVSVQVMASGILPEVGSSAGLSPSLSAEKSIRFIKPGRDFLKNEKSGVVEKSWFWLLHLLGLLLVGASYIYRSYQIRLESDRAFARRVQAYPRAKKQLKKLAKEKISQEELCSQLKKILLEYFGNHFASSPYGLLEEEMEEIMKSNQVPEELRKKFFSLLRILTESQFAGSRKELEKKELVAQVEDLIICLEKGKK